MFILEDMFVYDVYYVSPAAVYYFDYIACIFYNFLWVYPDGKMCAVPFELPRFRVRLPDYINLVYDTMSILNRCLAIPRIYDVPF